MDLFDLGSLLEMFATDWSIYTRRGCLFTVFFILTTAGAAALVMHGWDYRWVGGVWFAVNLVWLLIVVSIPPPEERP